MLTDVIVLSDRSLMRAPVELDMRLFDGQKLCVKQ
jgi:hypothetical protein